MNKEQAFAFNMRTIGFHGTDEDFRALSSLLRMMYRLRMPVPPKFQWGMEIALNIWGDMMWPMSTSEVDNLAARV